MNYKIRLTLGCSLAILLAVMGAHHGLHAQAVQDSSYQAIGDKFFSLLQQSKPGEAIDYIAGTGPLKDMPDDMGPLKTKFVGLAGKLGPYISRTKLTDKSVGGIFVYQHYFVAYELQPISVRIKYYKPNKTWICQAIQFDTNVSELIQKEADDKLIDELK